MHFDAGAIAEHSAKGTIFPLLSHCNYKKYFFPINIPGDHKQQSDCAIASNGLDGHDRLNGRNIPRFATITPFLRKSCLTAV